MKLTVSPEWLPAGFRAMKQDWRQATTDRAPVAARGFSDGLAAFTVIGVKVALVAQLDWFWAPILAAMTCAGGGILSDIVLARESDVLKGELYEEVAAIGGLVLVGLLWLANVVGHSFVYIIGVIGMTLVLVFVFRLVVIAKDLRSPLLGD